MSEQPMTVPPAAQADDLLVYKLDDRGREVWRYPARVIGRDGRHVRLEAFFNRDDMDLGYTVFKRGDRFIEYFYNDRWYNIFAIYDRDAAALKGWYCNICRPAELADGVVRCEDLALDLWVSAAGATTVLDEDEFAELVIGDGERQQAERALAELLGLAAAGTLPR